MLDRWIEELRRNLRPKRVDMEKKLCNKNAVCNARMYENISSIALTNSVGEEL
jgi:hypothetical protein